ncbi:TolC family protein [Variovorax sp. LG9.2]|uniref:TolC family protein n=1 Tax=Variovorax sp. LG9.2 TaxID=3048626 RepID=UPI002B222562|nr:TolC family protein [Variovorax sp. LG9.2]MEB0056209.1 TolC family protein [Variovorax sp. LG9.2]
MASLFVDIVDLKTWLQPSWRTPLVVLAACFLASCTTPPETKLAASEAAQAYRARSLDDPSLRAFAARLDEEYSMWPPALFDAQALHVVALHFSPNITVAKARWHVAQAAVTTAGERQNPTLSLNPLYVTTAAAGMSPWFLSAGLVQLLETGSKRSYRVAHAEYLAEAARLEILAAAWSVLSRVDNLLLDTASAQGRLAALDEQIVIQTELVEAARKRLAMGLGSSLELVTARSVLTRATLDRQATSVALTETLHQLAIAAGIPAAQLTLDRLALPSLTRPLPPDFAARVRGAAPLNRADLLARLADYAASDATVRLQLAGRAPNFDVGPGFEYDQGNRKWGVSLAVALPIFNQNGGAISEALSTRRQAADQFTAAQAAIIGEVDRATAAYEQSTTSLQVAEQLYAEHAVRARIQETLFARGEIDKLELLVVRSELAAAVTARADAQGTVAKAALAVEAAGKLAVDEVDLTTNFLAQVQP